MSDSNFPTADVETCIRDALEIEQAAQQVLRPHPSSACEPDVDSLVVVEVLCAIEEMLGINLPPSFVPRGGYDDVEACVSELLREASAVWEASVKHSEEQHA